MNKAELERPEKVSSPNKTQKKLVMCLDYIKKYQG